MCTCCTFTNIFHKIQLISPFSPGYASADGLRCDDCDAYCRACIAGSRIACTTCYSGYTLRVLDTKNQYRWVHARLPQRLFSRCSQRFTLYPVRKVLLGLQFTVQLLRVPSRCHTFPWNLLFGPNWNSGYNGGSANVSVIGSWSHLGFQRCPQLDPADLADQTPWGVELGSQRISRGPHEWMMI